MFTFAAEVHRFPRTGLLFFQQQPKLVRRVFFKTSDSVFLLGGAQVRGGSLPNTVQLPVLHVNEANLVVMHLPRNHSNVFPGPLDRYWEEKSEKITNGRDISRNVWACIKEEF